MNEYPKIYALGKPETVGIFKEPVVVEEKYDGSQISFMLTNDDELVVHSRRRALDLENPENSDSMFNVAIQAIQERKNRLMYNFVYRGEYLRSPRHNKLKYERVPEGNIVIFDIQKPDGVPLMSDAKVHFAKQAGFEPVQILYYGNIHVGTSLDELMERESSLGGKIEGVVIKNYSRMGDHAPWLFAKYVSEEYKEVKSKSLKPSRMEEMVEQYATDTRFEKAVQHLREDGELSFGMEDIPKIMREVGTDLFEEEYEIWKERLAKAYWKEFVKAVTKNVPNWWRQELAKNAFEDVE